MFVWPYIWYHWIVLIRSKLRSGERIIVYWSPIQTSDYKVYQNLYIDLLYILFLNKNRKLLFTKSPLFSPCLWKGYTDWETLVCIFIQYFEVILTNWHSGCKHYFVHLYCSHLSDFSSNSFVFWIVLREVKSLLKIKSKLIWFLKFRSCIV